LHSTRFWELYVTLVCRDCQSANQTVHTHIFRICLTFFDNLSEISFRNICKFLQIHCTWKSTECMNTDHAQGWPVPADWEAPEPVNVSNCQRTRGKARLDEWPDLGWTSCHGFPLQVQIWKIAFMVTFYVWSLDFFQSKDSCVHRWHCILHHSLSPMCIGNR